MICNTAQVVDCIQKLGDAGVFIGMFLESSVVPIPSEVVIIGASSVGIPVISIVFFGSLGATLGAMVGYCLGRYAAMPVILKYGRFVLIKPHHIEKAENFARKFGSCSVLIGRVLPVVPFKVFSIAAGIVRIRFLPFVICTLVGVIPRMFLLSMFGASLAKYTKPTLLITGAIILIFLAYKLSRRFYSDALAKNG
jgi:membrane protein DedA with SNARE-associated domain